MTEIKVHIQGLDKFLAAVRQSPRVVGKHLQNAVTAATYQFQRGTKETIITGRGMYRRPFQTGELWRNVFANIFPLRGEVYDLKEYAIYVHQGTYKMQARPFLEITEQAEQGNIEKIFTNELDAAMNEIARSA